MANTFTRIYLHFVFAVRCRACLISPEWRDRLCKYITGIVQMKKHKLLAINGTQDHLHLLVGYNPQQRIPDLLQDLKGSSSRWVNQQNFLPTKFSWQQGYGAFSHSQSQVDRVVKYILNQETHHRNRSMQQEYKAMLEKYRVQFEPKYILQDVE